MSKHKIVQLSLEQAIKAALQDRTVFMIDLDAFEKIHDLQYMPLNEIKAFDNMHSVVYIEVSRVEGGENAEN